MSLNIKNLSITNLTVCIFLFFLLLNSIYYTLIGLNIQFLRAESGNFVSATALSPEETEIFLNKNVYSVHHGHYTPLIFLAEYWQSKVFNTQEIFWFWRQMIVVALFLTSIAFFSINLIMLGKANQKPTLNISLISVSIAIIFGFQPIVTNLVAWPFMAFQFICLTLSAISFLYLIKFAQTNHPVHLWVALGFGYLTMHSMGTGLAISLSALFTSTLLIALKWYGTGLRKPSQILKLLIPVFFVTILTIGHAYIMVKGVADALESEKVSLATSGVRFGGILIEMLHASVNYIWAPGGLAWPMMRGLETDSVYGWGLVLIIGTIVISQIFKFLKEPDSETFVRIAILTLPSLTLFLIVGMIIYRGQSYEDKNALINYIIGTRYLIFSSFFGFLFCTGLFLKSKIVLSKTVISTLAIAAIVCLAGNTTFMVTIAPEIWPTNLISHTKYWNDVLSSLETDSDYKSANWNKPMSSVTEFDYTPLNFRTLIEKQLKSKRESL